MRKHAAQIALEILIKQADYDENMRRMVESVAKKYKQYGVDPPTPGELKTMFKGFDPKGGGSWQEVLLKSDWMNRANQMKAGGGYAAAGTAGEGARSAGSWWRRWGPRNYDAKRSREYYRTQRNARRAAYEKMGLGVSSVRRGIGRGMGAAGLAGLAGLGAYGAYKHFKPLEVEDVKMPEGFSKRRRAGLKSGLVMGTTQPYAVAGGLSSILLGGGLAVKSPLVKQVIKANPIIGILGGISAANLLGSTGDSFGREIGKSIHGREMDSRLNAAITGALETGKEDQALNREIKYRLGLRKAAGLLANAV